MGRTWQCYRWERIGKVYNKFGNSGDIVLWVTEIGIRNKKLNRSKGWWSSEIQAAVKA